MLYVGANDGMLHAFNACSLATDTTRPAQCNTGSTTPGAELLGYIPSPVFRNLSKLTSRSYSHEYFVDGSPAVQDALVGSTWKSVLVGGLNRGGQGVYALDVSNPENFSEANASSLVLWEFTDADDPDLGYTYGTPTIAKMRNGKWAAIVSSGYNNSQTSSTDPAEVSCTSGTGTVSDPYRPRVAAGDSTNCSTSLNGQGYVFVIFLDGPSGANGSWVQGTDYIKLSTGTGTAGTPNGVAAPYPADINGDGQTDVIYAGDLNGALWRFDVSSTTPASWTSAASRLLLFNATDAALNPQPITAGLEATPHPSGDGVIVTFGTGKYLEANDINPPGPTYTTQTLYGIWDKPNKTAVSGRDALMPQLLQPGITNIVTTANGTFRITTAHLPNYSSTVRDSPDITRNDTATVLLDLVNSVSTVPSTPADQRGWYLDLFNNEATNIPAGERVINAPFLRGGIVLFSSLWPTGSSCEGSTAGSILTLQVSTGSRPTSPVFDINANALVNAGDMINVGTTSNPINVAVSSMFVPGNPGQVPTVTDMGTNNQSVLTFPKNTGGTDTGYAKFPGSPGRVSWREILY
jgi:type IV pilus assembly protein PilY1